MRFRVQCLSLSSMKWEYKFEKLMLEYPSAGIMPPEDILNELGKDGWEAVGMLHNPEPREEGDNADTIVLFKRPISR